MRIILNDAQALGEVVAARATQECVGVADTLDHPMAAYDGPSGLFNAFGYGAPWAEMEDAVLDIIEALGEDYSAVMPAWDLTHMESCAAAFATLDLGGAFAISHETALSGLMRDAADNDVASIVCSGLHAKAICGLGALPGTLRRLVVLEGLLSEGDYADLSTASGLTVVPLKPHCSIWKSPGRGLRGVPDLPDIGQVL